jgi:hypothetical protein
MRRRLSFVVVVSVVVAAFATGAEGDDLRSGLRAELRDLAGEGSHAPTLHTVFSTECNAYFDWQSLGLYNSWRRVGQKGKFTRLMACDASPAPGRDVVPDTHVHPNYAKHPVSGDEYSAYNKPASIDHWLKHATVTADYIIVLDADMIFRTAMTAELLGVKLGSPVSARYSYLKGTLPENYMGVKKRVPNVEKTQQVGGFTVMHRSDLTRLAPRWLYWTEQVRSDPDSWANTGDIYNDNGKAGAPWISEMYGYVFAAAEVGIHFQVHDDFMLYPGYMPPQEPFPIVLHYGLTFNVMDWAFSKAWYHNFDATTCPGRLFERPPEFSELKSFGRDRRRDEVALHCAWGLYNATRDWNVDKCGIANPEDPPRTRYKCNSNRQGVLNCEPLSMIDDTLRGGDDVACKDGIDACCDWAASGECTKNPGFMLDSCPQSCNQCPDRRCSGRCCPPREVGDKTLESKTVGPVVHNLEEEFAERHVGSAAREEPKRADAIVHNLEEQIDARTASEDIPKPELAVQQHEEPRGHFEEALGERPRVIESNPKFEDVAYELDSSSSSSISWGAALLIIAIFIVVLRIRVVLRRHARRRRVSQNIRL